MIRDILMYMDRVFVSMNKHLPVYDLGLVLFRDNILCDKQIGPHVRNILLDMVARERRGEVVDRTALKNACSMLMRLGVSEDRNRDVPIRDVPNCSAMSGSANVVRAENREVYEQYFETQFLNQSAEFYRVEAERLLDENSASVYIRNAEARIKEEAERARNFLEPSTEAKIVAVLKETLIRQNMLTIVEMENSGMVHMLKNQRVDDLGIMFRLFSEVEGGLDCMLTCLSNYLMKQGSLLVAEGEGDQSKDPVQFVQSILELKDCYDKFILEAFDEHKLFRQRVASDFERFINQNQRSAEYLSLFIDEKLKRGAKGLSDAELEAVLDKAIVLFRFLSEKDVFERYYKQHLAKRLLFMRSGSDDTEKAMISKLKLECGCQFTSKLEGMFKDMGLSSTLHEEFRNYISQRDCDLQGVDLQVRVLTAVYWPITSAPGSGHLPINTAASFEIFKQFYNTKHANRRLALQPQLGTADLNACFYGAPKLLPTEQGGGSEDVTSSTNHQPGKARKHILVVSTQQMIVLMLFNQRDSWNFEELKAETEIPAKELIRALQALAVGKPSQRILCKEPHSREVEPNHVFTVNDSFASRCLRVRVQAVSTGRAEPEPERQEARARIDEDRNLEIEAAIVRILKARKQMRHNQLVAEVTEQLRRRFTPSPIVIKRRVENLIEKEYLTRSQQDRSLYIYQA